MEVALNERLVLGQQFVYMEIRREGLRELVLNEVFGNGDNLHGNMKGKASEK